MNILEKDRLLFMKYAVPCAGTIVKRGTITKGKWEDLIRTVVSGKEISSDDTKIFKVAFSACSLIAIDSGKQEIDEEVIRQYYLFEHDSMIDRRYEEVGDFDTQACRIRPGIVKTADKGFAVVETSSGEKMYRTDYCAVKEGDIVTTHWNFVVEKIAKETADMMKKQKIELKVI